MARMVEITTHHYHNISYYIVLLRPYSYLNIWLVMKTGLIQTLITYINKYVSL